MRATNREFAKNNSLFLKCIELAGIKERSPGLSLKRQASKFRAGKGIANTYRATAKRFLERTK